LKDDEEILAWYHCTEVSVSGSVCKAGRIEIDDDAYSDISDLLRTNLVCHELGHSIGFHHGRAKTSCMNSGDNAKLDAWELFAISWQY